MTAQIPDSLFLEDRAFSIVGVNGTGLFDPSTYALQPMQRITNCWRGYVCAYKTFYNRLLLDALQVNLQSEGPAINSIGPVFSRKNTFDNMYGNLNLPIDFSGGILAARDFIQGLYVHMGFHPAWKYKTVFELVVTRGLVIEAIDVSERMQEIRDERVKAPLEPGANVTKEQIEAWVASTFKLDYNF